MQPAAEFAPRPMRVAFDESLPRYWYGGNVFVTHYMNALSLLFPHGEKFFIDAVRACRDRSDDAALQAQIRAFVGQEGWHRSVHAGYNAWLERIGLPAARLEARHAAKLDLARNQLSPRGWLAATICAEHFTAIMAHDLLANPERSEPMDAHFARLWRWHALEELEHKAVAYDLFVASGGRYATRVRSMLLVTLNFTLDVAGNLIALLRADGQLWKPRVWAQGFSFLFGRRPGLFWKLLPGWLAFFRRDFHPWQQDDRALVRRAADELGIEPAAG